MKVIFFDAQKDVDRVYQQFSSGAVLMDLGNVFALIGLPTVEGVSYLNEAKKRLSGKSYGSMVGSSLDFVSSSKLDNSSKELLNSNLKDLGGCFLRLPWKSGNETELMMNGTHQGLIMDEPYRSFCLLMEERMKEDKTLNFFSEFRWLICSSANISGAISGSITKENEALKFGIDRDIGLLVKFKNKNITGDKGSFPIYSIDNGSFKMERTGPNADEIRKRLIDMGFLELI